jgi:regulatory protein
MLELDERVQRGLELAHAYLNRRDRTVSEVRSQLERRGIAPEPADAAIAILVEQGYLDDARFAQLFVADKRELEQWGNERIVRGLLARGIERELAERTLDGAGDDDAASSETELERAVAVLQRRFPTPPADARERQRAVGLLMRKGYASELAYDAIAAHAREG